MTVDELIAALLAAPDAPARHELLAAQPDLINLALVQKLKEHASQVERDDAHSALKVGEVAEEVAVLLGDDSARALAVWAQANALGHLEYELAAQKYEQADVLFAAAGQPLNAARTRIGHISALTYLGRYAEAQALADAARPVFVREADAFSLGKVEMNLGILYFQSGQLAQSLAAFEQAVATFETQGEAMYAAMNQVNAGNVLIQLDRILEAEQLYTRAQPVFESGGMRTAVAVLDQDIAGLQYARGYYAEAFHTLERARAVFSALNMDIKIADMDLNESDLYLDLNLPQDALRLAEQAEHTFAQKGVSFELARARANRAIALARLNPNAEAIDLLGQARDLFREVNNEVWATHAELQRAEVLGRVSTQAQATPLLAEVARKYQTLGLKTKQAYANIVAASWLIDGQHWTEALALLDMTRTVLGDLSVPWLLQRIETEVARVHEGLGDSAQAIQHYQAAVEQIESLATAIAAEEQRTAFVADKTAPYEALVALWADRDPALALTWAERAKSRALVDLLAGKVRPHLYVTDAVDRQRADSLQTLRQELNWLYARLTRVALPDESGPPIAGAEIWPRIHEKESQITALWHDLQAKHAESLSLEHVSQPDPAALQAQLPAGTALVEYFIARDQVLAFVVTPNGFTAHTALASLSTLQPLLEDLAFQFSKFQYGPAYYQRHASALYEATVDVLNQLFHHIMEPLWPEIADADSLIIIPHGPLHALPFHALYRGSQPLVATHSVAYAPSAAVLQFCLQKQLPLQGVSLLLGLPDPAIPQVTNEIQHLAQHLPQPVVLMEADATFERLRDLAPSASILHLATHGLFRPEAPLLSGVRLADRWLTAQDVYDLDLRQASLVSLSACESGLGQVAGGDDVVGLVRGFLYAGAASLLVSLWRVADETMIGLMDSFYQALLTGETKAQALRRAQQALMTTHPHPYFWAPLVLVGNVR